MKISELYRDPFFTLPKQPKANENFEEFVKNELESFKSKIKQIKSLEELPFDLSQINNRQVHLIKNINEAIYNYLNGKPAEAFNKLKEGLQGSEKNFRRLLNIREFKRETDFYRLRYNESNKVYSKQNFFHIPFELRGKVKTQRFSIPGFPSLYLGNSVYVCWEELNRPNISHFQGVRLSNIETVNVIDLSPPKELELESFYNYLMVWPLIFASSIKVSNPNDDFKPEYIIPQLLLQYVREDSSIDGISYQTTHINFNESLSEGEFLNLVLPVKTNSIKGLCKSLTEMFLITEANSYQLHNIATEGAPFYTSKEDGMQTNVNKIELVKGRATGYKISSLCELEGTLQKMDLLKIN
ncbi:hypothetical protein [Psychroflexus sp. MES1-P1E]|uniref:hypothetical protein n=1 Tax=Psychroflexus sp. MES1-P1E TaxID=2058320 RepID=UPI000C7D292A|nr:hypothetical protein [Psychroflexus sp. MES1-P1E]PKG43539.1 hypothetical protein CXF67_04565 [Psychroflexus sp. MES1-P1E]